MAQAAIFMDGKVRQTTNLSEITFNNKTGFIATFKFNNIKYTHVSKDRFNYADKNWVAFSAGYYDESKFLKYLTNDGVLADDLPGAKLVLNKITDAVLNDTVVVRFLKVVYPYTEFCTVNKYTWDFDPNAKVLDDAHFNIIIQPGYTLIPENIPVVSTAAAFYNKNIELVKSSDFEDDKDNGAYYISLIALLIHRINRDIFPLFSQSVDLAPYILDQNTEWGTGTIFILPSLADIVTYFSNLTNFYNVVYANQTTIAAASEKIKLFWLVNCLSASGISILSVEDKLYIITQAVLTSKKLGLTDVVSSVFTTLTAPFIPVNPSMSPSADAKWLLKTAPGLILKVVESVTLAEVQGDDFLAQLYKTGIFGIDKDETIFESVYNFLGNNEVGNIIGDNKTGRVVGRIFGKPDDRKKFIELLYQIWNKTIYNPYYSSPKYTLPANSSHVFPESYYMTDTGIQNYNPDNATILFVFDATATTDLVSYTSTFSFEFDDKKITAYRIVTEKFNIEHGGLDTNRELYGTYDLYQPVSLVGFKNDLDITMPNANCIPLFFLYYAEDYKDVKDADALIELVVNIGLNFTGVGELGDAEELLGYLKQVSKFQDLEGLEASQALLSWQAVRGTNSTVQLTAGTVLAISNYVNTVTTDPRLKVFTSYLDMFLGTVLLGSVCFHPIIKGKVTFAAQQVTAAYDGLPTELRSLLTAGGVTTTEINSIRVFSDDVVAAKILRFSNSNELRDAILALDDANLVRFLNDFGNIPDDLLAKLKNSPEYVEYWSGLSDAEKDVANADKVISFTNWYKSYVTARAQEMFDSGIWIDIRKSNATRKVTYKINELETIVELDIKYKAGFRPNGAFEAGDAIATTGVLKAKSVDVMGMPPKAFTAPGSDWVISYDDAIKEFKQSIDAHFQKIVSPQPGIPSLDKLVIDFKGFDSYNPQLRTDIMQYINDSNYTFYNIRNSDKFEIIN